MTDADTGQLVGGAVVTIENVTIGTPRGEVHSPDGVGTSAVSDGGGFRLEPLVRENSARITLSVRPPDGYEGNSEWFTQKFSPATPIESLVLSVYPTLTLRPGESIQTRVHLRHYQCGEDFLLLPCRRVVIESAPNEPVEVELVPPTASDNGLEHSPILEFARHGYQRRVTSSGGSEVYIVGGSSPVTLTARRP